MTRLVLVLALTLVANVAAHAQAPSYCESFTKNDDGSWSAMRNVRVPFGGRTLNFNEGSLLKPGAAIAGVDFAAELEKDCPSVVARQVEEAKQVSVETYADKSGNIDMQTMTCAQLALTRPHDAEFLALWLSGWSNGAAKRQTVNVTKIKNGMGNLLAYCRANPDKRVVQANEDLMRAERK